MISGVPGVRKAKVVILGGGFVGTNACRMVLGLGADVTVVDLSIDRLVELDEPLQQPDQDRVLHHPGHRAGDRGRGPRDRRGPDPRRRRGPS